MRKLALLFALLLLPAQAWALNISDLLSTIAMPLAVAAVANTGVSSTRLADLVTALNQANVPPTQFVEVVRYVPVALVVQPNGQTDLVQYVQTQVSQGVTGDALVNAIANQLSTTYNVTPQLMLPAPATTFVVQDNFIPAEVLSQIGLSPSDLVASAFMPVAVDTVSNIAGVPQDALVNLITTLNQANVPAPQVVEIIRFAPAALVVNNGQPFVQFVQQQVSQGVIGQALVPIVVQQLQTFLPPQTQIAVTAPPSQPMVIDEEHFVPPAVVSRVEEARGNPFGGPPGQIKKQLGLQTGAEVVHGEKPGRQFTPAPVAVAPMPMEHGRGRGVGHMRHGGMPAPMMSSTPAPAPAPAPMIVPTGHGRGHGRGHEVAAPVAPVPAPAPAASPAVAPPPAAQGVPPGQAKGHGNGGGKGHGHGKD